MQVFKAFLKVLKKELPTALIYMGVFLAIAIGFVMLGRDGDNTFEQTKLYICIFDEDNTPQSRSLADFIGRNNEIVELENDKDVIIDALYYERVDCVITIKKGYSQQLADPSAEDLIENLKMHEGYDEALMDMLLEKYVSTVRGYSAAGNSLDQAVSKAEAALSDTVEVNFSSKEKKSGNTVINAYFRYLAYILICVITTTITPVIAIMYRKDLRFRTNCSGIAPTSYTNQIILGSAGFVAAIWLLFMVGGAVLQGGLYQGKIWLAVLNSFSYTLFAASLAVVLACFSLGSNAVNLITQVISLGMSFFCGVFVEQSMLSENVLLAARFLPAYWYVRANDMIFSDGAADLSEAALCLVMQLAFAVSLGLLAILINRLRYIGGLRKKAPTA